MTPNCAMEGLHIYHEAWNRRATQPAAGEAVAKPIAYVNYAANGQPYLDWLPGGEDESHALFSAPPAAAHGDEAVAWVECDPSAANLDRLPHGWQFLFSTKFHVYAPGDCSPNVVFPLHSALRAQAGEGGE